MKNAHEILADKLDVLADAMKGLRFPGATPREITHLILSIPASHDLRQAAKDLRSIPHEEPVDAQSIAPESVA